MDSDTASRSGIAATAVTLSFGQAGQGRSQTGLIGTDGLDGLVVRFIDAVLISVREVGVQQPMKKVRRWVLGQGDLYLVVRDTMATAQASCCCRVFGNGNAQANEQANDEGHGQPPDGGHFSFRLGILGSGRDESSLLLFLCAQQSSLQSVVTSVTDGDGSHVVDILVGGSRRSNGCTAYVCSV